MSEDKPPENEITEAPQGRERPGTSRPVNASETKPATEQQLKRVETDMNAFERSTLRWTKATFFVFAITLVFIALQWKAMRDQLREMQSGSTDTHTLAQQAITQATQTTSLAGLAQKQVEMTRQQLAGTMAATVKFAPDVNHIGLQIANEVAMVLFNDGKVFSPNVQLDLTAARVSIPDLRVLSQLPRYSQTLPQLPPGQQGAGAPYKVPFKLERDFSLQKESIKFEGTLRFGDGFGGRFEQRFCFVYVGAFSVKTDVGQDYNGSGFVYSDSSCNGLRERLQRAYSHLPKQQ